MLLLSGSAGTGAERVGVTDSHGLPGARAGAGIRWGSPGRSVFFGKRGWFCETPALPVTASLSQGAPKVRLAAGPGEVPLAVGASRLLPGAQERDVMWVTPEQSQISLWWGLGAQAAL